MTERKNDNKKKKNILLLVLILICVGIIGFSAYKLISIRLDYKAGTDEYDDLRKYTKDTEADIAPASGSAGTDGTSEKSDAAVTQTPSKDTDEDGGTDAAEAEHAPITVDHAALQAISSDYVGWLYLGEMNISYPMVKGPDNDYYLHRSMRGGYLYSGTLFLDYQNSSDFSDPHTIVYGHNMKDQSMFGTLKLMMERGAISDDTFWILTPEKNYKFKIFSMQVCAYDAPVYTLYSDAGDLFRQYINARSLESVLPGLDTAGALEPPKVVTLSTCYGTGETGDRFVVQGILVLEEDNE